MENVRVIHVITSLFCFSPFSIKVVFLLSFFSWLFVLLRLRECNRVWIQRFVFRFCFPVLGELQCVTSYGKKVFHRGSALR